MARLSIPDEPTSVSFTVTTPTSAFPISFALFDKADLIVTVDEFELDQSGFTFSGSRLEGGGYKGGTVTLNTAVDDVTVLIRRVVNPQRSTNFAPSGAVPVGSVDMAFNRVTASQQDLLREIRRIQFYGLTTGLDAEAARIAIDANFLVRGALPIDNYLDMIAPAGQFRDNVLRIQNNSFSDGLYGNAAIAFYDSGNNAKGALGFSRNSSIQPTGYIPDLFYNEVGAFFGDFENPSDWGVVCTIGGNPSYSPPGDTKQFLPLRYRVKEDLTEFRVRSAAGKIISYGDFYVGESAATREFGVKGASTTLKMREYAAGEDYIIVANATKASLVSGGAIAGENPAKSSWAVRLNAGSDYMSVLRREAGGISGMSELARFDPSGRFNVNQVGGVGTNGKIAVTGSAAEPALSAKSVAGDAFPTVQVWNNATANNNILLQFATEATYTNRGNIAYNRAGAVIAYNTTSDYRAKDILGPIEHALDRLMTLQPHRGRMHGASADMDMFVAHEVNDVAPYAVTGKKDAVDEQGAPIMQGVDQAKLVPLLVAAMQEMAEKVAELERRSIVGF